MSYQYITNLLDDSDNMKLVLLDEQEKVIPVMIRSNFVPKFRPLIQEGQIYTIKNFRLAKYKETETHKPTPLEWKIVFLLTTILNAHENPKLSIKSNKFNFYDFEGIKQCQYYNQHLTDIQGKLATVGEIQEVTYLGNLRAQRDIHILMPDGNKIRVSLWGALSLEIEENGINLSSKLVHEVNFTYPD